MGGIPQRDVCQHATALLAPERMVFCSLDASCKESEPCDDKDICKQDFVWSGVEAPPMVPTLMACCERELRSTHRWQKHQVCAEPH